MSSGLLKTTVSRMANGADEVAGTGQNELFAFAATWAEGDTYAVTLSNALTTDSQLLGAGTVTGIQPTFVYTYNDKINLLAGTGWYFSDNGRPTVFNDPRGVGNSFIELANSFGMPEDLTAIATYQGRLLITSRKNTQIWSVDPDLQNYQKGQLLQNIGTMAPLSVQAVGDMDVFMLADNGIRSVRVRDASNNAIIADVGTPIDEIIQALLSTLTEAQKALACGIIEPTSNRYWLYIPTGHIYVLSFFPTSGILAWTRYTPNYTQLTIQVGVIGTNPPSFTESTDTIYSGLVVGEVYYWLKQGEDISLTCGTDVLTATGYFTAKATTATKLYNSQPLPLWTGALYRVSRGDFIPEKFVVLNGRVYARDRDKLILYGGSDNQTYDDCAPQYDMPFLNAKSPATRKTYTGLDHIADGSWTVSIGTNVADEDAVTPVLVMTGPSVMRGKALAAKQGTHFKIRGVERSHGYARFSSAILHFDMADDK